MKCSFLEKPTKSELFKVVRSEERRVGKSVKISGSRVCGVCVKNKKKKWSASLLEGDIAMAR